jgi:hypothetical protein
MRRNPPFRGIGGLRRAESLGFWPLYLARLTRPTNFEVALCFDDIPAPVALSEGLGREAMGGLFTAGEALSPRWSEHMALAGAEWLIPFIEKISQSSPDSKD